MDGLFKVLKEGKGTHSDKPWPLPQGDEPGDWLTVTGPLVMCKNGLHVTDWQGVWQHWMVSGGAVYHVEVDGERVGRLDEHDRKLAAKKARLLRPVADDELPEWWRNAQAFIATIMATPWLQRQGNPDPAWKVFPTRASARASARDAVWYSVLASARASARDAAVHSASDAARETAWTAEWTAASDAALLAQCLVVADVIPPEHLAHARARWDVWQRGYGLYGDVNGVLYVYEERA